MVAGLLDRVTGNGGAATLTAPRVTLTPGGGSGGGLASALGGGLGGALDSLLGGGGGEGLTARVLSVMLTRGLLPMLDTVEIHLAPGEGALPAQEDALTLGLTVGDAAATFAGAVAEREPRATGAGRLVLTNGGALLARLRVDECQTDRTPGDIVADLAQRVGVQTDGLSGEALPRCVLDAATPAHIHIARLAAMAGGVAAFDDDGTLRLIDDTGSGESAASLVAGGNLLDWHITERRATVGALTVDGAGAEGAGRWAWLRKQPGPMRAVQGTGVPERRRPAPAQRSPAAAAALAGALVRNGARSAARARFLATGQPAVRPGGLVAVVGVAGAEGDWRVLRVTHRFDRAAGLVTEIAAAPAGAGAGSAVAGILGGLL